MFRRLPSVLSRHRAADRKSAPRRESSPRLESLESRVVLYSASGNAWPAPQFITLSFMPDGTNVGGKSSNLMSTFNAKFGSASAWENIFLKAAQTWAAQTNINFAVVPDSGAPQGAGANQQGDPNFGDIRIGGYNFNSTTLAQAFMPPPVNNYSVAGDVLFNTGQSFNNGTTYDLYTVAVHEIGHALGLYHSGVASAEEYASYNGSKGALSSDDIAGIQSIYGGARKQDAYDAAASNGGPSSATNVTSSINATTLTALVTGGDITATSDRDYYKIVAPTGGNGSLTVQVTSQGLSLLTPTLSVLDSNGTDVTPPVTNAGHYGTVVSATVSGIVAGSTYYVKVSQGENNVLGTGAYAFTLQFGTTAAPAVSLPSTSKANGSPLSSGGGQALKVNSESLVNTTINGKQANWQYDGRYTAMDANGNYVIAWQSAGQDGDGQGVYAQRFDANGNKLGGEFRVNTTTAGNQTTPSVAMDANGDFVIVWTSDAQDGSGLGVYGQRYNSQGVAQGGEFRANTTTAGDQQYAGVAMDQLGNFTVTWTSSGQDGSGQGVYAQRYTALGLKLGFETRVNTSTAGDQQVSRIAMDYLGDSVITWTSTGQDGSGLGVYAQRYNPAGLPVGGEFRVNTTTAGDQSYSSVAMDAMGDFAIAWQGFAQDGSGWGVYGQRYNSQGVAQGGEFRVNTTTTGDQAFPTVSMDNGGDVLVSWSGNATPSNSSTSFPTTSTYWNTFGQQYTASGQPLGGEVQLNTSTGSDQKYSSLAMDSQGHVIVSWSGGNAVDSNGVLAQQLYISFSGDSADGYYAEGDLNDPDQAHPAPGPLPAPVVPPAAPAAPVASRGGHDAAVQAAVDRALAETERLFPAGAGLTAAAVHHNRHGRHHEARPRGRAVTAAEVRVQAHARLGAAHPGARPFGAPRHRGQG